MRTRQILDKLGNSAEIAEMLGIASQFTVASWKRTDRRIPLEWLVPITKLPRARKAGITLEMLVEAKRG